ncbi:MAG: TonB-dependent receptor [Porticoccaceae bacterium]
MSFKMGNFLKLIVLLAAFSGVPLATAEVSEIVTIASRQNTERAEVLASTAVVDQDDLELLSHAHIQQPLSRLAGVNLNRGNGQEYLPAIRSPVLTGAGACGGFLMAEDGIPLRAAGFCNINELFEAHSEVAQRIEVLRGPGTVLYGSNAIHGVINIITPTIDAVDSLGYELGPNDYHRLKLTATANDFAVSTSLTSDGGYREQSGFDQQKLSLRHRSNSGKLSIDSGLTATNLNQETAGYISGDFAYKDRAKAQSNPNPEAFRDARSLRLWSRMAYQLPAAELIVTPYVRHTQMDFLQHFLPGTPLEQNGQFSLGTQISYHFSPADKLELIVGTDAEYSDGYLRQSQDSPTEGSTFLQNTVPVGKHYDYQVDVMVAALFANSQWSVTDNWTLHAGARYESTHYDYHNQMLAGRTRDDGTSCESGGCRYSRPPSGSNSFDNWSGDMGFIHKLSDSHSIYGRLSRAFRAPQATELYRLQREQQVADLDSESLVATELGIRGSSDRVDYSIAIYKMQKDNFIYRDTEFFNVSDGRTEHLGVEAQLGIAITEQIEFNLAATYARHRYRQGNLVEGVDIGGNAMDTAPRHFGNARLLWRPSDQTQLELEWQLMGEYFLDPQNLHSYPGHSVFNVSASHRLSEQLNLYARVLNITDRAYAERADYSRFSGERFFPGEPRSLNLGIQWQW